MAFFANKAFAITGGASGIGLELAKLLSSRGAAVSIADMQESALDAAAATIEQIAKGSWKSPVLLRKVDVRCAEEVDAWIRQTKDTFGQLDGAANFAGVAGRMGASGIMDQDEEDWQFVLAVNLTGVMHCMRAELRVLSPGGSIVNAASVAGLRGTPNAGPYSASKHGVIGLSRSVAKEVGGQGTRINCVAPGPISTPLFHGTKDINHQAIGDATAMKRYGEPEEVAALAAFLLSDQSTYITGAVYTVDGGSFC
ncbi:hypothetical protein LTR93_011327 [Exophiala xenobiotica]|nr:hypothetical protein LTR93_011327 [Exophiala xenobiotica]